MGISFESIYDGFYWVIMALFMLISLISLRYMTRPVKFSVGSHSVALLFNMITFAAYSMLINISANYTFSALFALTGIALGLGAGALSKVYTENNIVLLKRSIVSPLLIVMAYLVSIFFAAFGGDNLTSFGALLVIAATGLALGAGTTEVLRASKQQP